MTDREKAIVMAYTGTTMLTGDKLGIFYDYVHEKLGPCVMTHELAYQEVQDAIQEATKEDFIALAKADNGWISVKDRLPEENESMFAKFHATEMWSRAMWLKESETVLVGVAFPDGGQKVTVGRLRDGKWSTTVSQVIPHTVTHWMPLPEPPKEVSVNERATD